MYNHASVKRFVLILSTCPDTQYVVTNYGLQCGSYSNTFQMQFTNSMYVDGMDFPPGIVNLTVDLYFERGAEFNAAYIDLASNSGGCIIGRAYSCPNKLIGDFDDISYFNQTFRAFNMVTKAHNILICIITDTVDPPPKD